VAARQLALAAQNQGGVAYGGDKRATGGARRVAYLQHRLGAAAATSP
jgi:hypothetical protein